jgi:short-subunit dehydrogenase
VNKVATSTARRVALITGASAGIGAAFARVYAAHGFPLALTARRRDRLERLGVELRQQHGVDVHVFSHDMADPAAPARLFDDVTAAGLSVGILVNNAGYAVPGSYRASAWDTHAEFLRVMVVAYAELTHRFLPPMIEGQWGRIINVASLAGLVPGTAGHTLYAASKAFLIKFSESLGLEVERYGVHVTALCPGYTYSEFHDVAGIRELVGQLPRFMWMDTMTVAGQGYDAVESGRLVHVPGRMNGTLAVLARVLPQSLVHAVMRRGSHRFRKQ